MLFSSEEIFQLIQYIWATVLEVDVAPSRAALSADMGDGFLTGCVHITGDWEGTMTLSCPEELASLASSILLEVDQEAVTVDDMLDTVGELTNMIAGNLKGLIRGTCHISVPVVAHGLGRRFTAPGKNLLQRVTFESGGQTFEVMLLEGTVTAGEQGPVGPTKSLGTLER